MRRVLSAGAVLLLVMGVVACAGDQGAETASPGPETSASGLQKNFPDLEYLQTIPVAYATAKDNPEVLENIACYCPCMLYGHRALADCHRSQHSAACQVCLDEAVMAGEVIAERGGVDDPVAIANEVKSRYRATIIRNTLQTSDLPGLRTDGGRAYLAACSSCHQPPHPAMYTSEGWRQSLARMEGYMAQNELIDIDDAVWNQAVDYIRETAGQFPASSGEQYRASLASAVEYLVDNEGEAASYPTNADPILGPEWFERMVNAYRLAREIPVDRLAAVQLEDPNPACSNLLACLNGGAIVSEAAVEAVEALAAELNLTDPN
ncbi:MAG: hypothetical protein GKS06_01645 [Acidobacteria bacterium]|nr:hypothetical protein [Acidobacteriota bacterium]